MENKAALREPKFRGKYVTDNLVWPSMSLHSLKKLTGKESGSGVRHWYTPEDVRAMKLSMYEIDEAKVVRERPPLINCRMAKGGTGKTTTAANLATAMAFMGYKVLAIDGDPQASLTNMLGIDASTEEIAHLGTILKEAVENKGKANFDAAIRPVFPGGMLDLLPADITMTTTDSWLMQQLQRETVFDRVIDANLDFFGRYDVIICDAAPGTNLLTLNLMVAARTQLAVLWLDRENLKALPILLGNVNEINSAYPERASDIEIVANGYSTVYKQSRETLDVLVSKYANILNSNVIQQFSGFHRQQSLPGEESRGSLIEQEPSSPGAKSMLDLAKSLLGRYKIKIAGYDEAIPSVRTAAEVAE